MKTALRAATALASTLAAATAALAHPGHPAAPVHAHDLDEALLKIAVLVVATLVVGAVFAVRRSRAARRAKSKSRL